MTHVGDLINAMLLSISPLGEMRAGIPLAISKGIDPVTAYFACISANLLVFPLILFFFTNIHTKLFKFRFYKTTSLKLARRTKGKTGQLIQKYGFWGLMVFVLVPLPTTGAYVGSIAAWMFNINNKKAFVSISLGLILSGIIWTLFVMGGFAIFS